MGSMMSSPYRHLAGEGPRLGMELFIAQVGPKEKRDRRVGFHPEGIFPVPIECFLL